MESLGINEDDFEDLQSLFEVDALMRMKPGCSNKFVVILPAVRQRQGRNPHSQRTANVASLSGVEARH